MFFWLDWNRCFNWYWHCSYRQSSHDSQKSDFHQSEWHLWQAWERSGKLQIQTSLGVWLGAGCWGKRLCTGKLKKEKSSKVSQVFLSPLTGSSTYEASVPEIRRLNSCKVWSKWHHVRKLSDILLISMRKEWMTSRSWCLSGHLLAEKRVFRAFSKGLMSHSTVAMVIQHSGMHSHGTQGRLGVFKGMCPYYSGWCNRMCCITSEMQPC